MKTKQNLSYAQPPVAGDRFYFGIAPRDAYSCKDCPNRHIGCHADCPDYNGEKAEDDKRAKAELKRYYNPGFSKERERKLRKNERDRRNR